MHCGADSDQSWPQRKPLRSRLSRLAECRPGDSRIGGRRLSAARSAFHPSIGIYSVCLNVDPFDNRAYIRRHIHLFAVQAADVRLSQRHVSLPSSITWWMHSIIAQSHDQIFEPLKFLVITQKPKSPSQRNTRSV